jgi:penicillin-binding protein 1A
VSTFKKQSAVWRYIWKLDSYVSSAVYETFAALRRGFSAYSSILYRFRLSGFKRIVVDLLDDGLTFGTVAMVAVLALAIPPISETADVWNRGRAYAVTFTDSYGNIIGRRGILQDDNIPLSEIPIHVRNAALATEDARFYEHFGVDIIGTLRAMRENARENAVVQGGSSITQQVAKNLFLSPERSMKRKIHEAFFALWIEARLTKDEILKLYLDRSYLGGGAYGVEAAAQYYFGKSIRDVNLSEAAMLAGLFKAPSKYAPHVNAQAAQARANTVLYRMLDARFITQGEYLKARREPARIARKDIFDSPDWFLDYAYRETLATLEEQHITGDYVIEVKTTIDRRIQRAAQSAVNEMIDIEAPAYNATQAAVVTMENDGAVKAMVGGRNYEDSKFNRATDAERQPGSSFKAFVYMAALMNGFTPTSTVVDGPVSIGGWSPKNYTLKYAGRTTLTNALAQSYNSIPVKIMIEIGRKAILDTAHAAGIQTELENWAPTVLGASALSLLDLTTGYATFAAGGLVAAPYAILEIKRPNGDILYDRWKVAQPRERAFPEEKVAELNEMLHAVVTRGTGRRAFLGYAPQGGKTGTNQAYRDAWYIGFTGHYVTGVWFGNDDFTSMNKMTGGVLPAMTWKRVMDVAEESKVAIGLPGIPLTEEYAIWVAEHPAPPPPPTEPNREPPSWRYVSPVVVANVGPPKPQADASQAQTAKKKPRVARVAVDPGDEEAAIIRPKRNRDPVVGVLRDMFGWGDDDDDEKPKKKKKKKKAQDWNDAKNSPSTTMKRLKSRYDR